MPANQNRATAHSAFGAASSAWRRCLQLCPQGFADRPASPPTPSKWSRQVHCRRGDRQWGRAARRGRDGERRLAVRARQSCQHGLHRGRYDGRLAVRRPVSRFYRAGRQPGCRPGRDGLHRQLRRRTARVSRRRHAEVDAAAGELSRRHPGCSGRRGGRGSLCGLQHSHDRAPRFLAAQILLERGLALLAAVPGTSIRDTDGPQRLDQRTAEHLALEWH